MGKYHKKGDRKGKTKTTSKEETVDSLRAKYKLKDEVAAHLKCSFGDYEDCVV